MLDQITKRKIDSARQILVGKVPDPKQQVDQITNALIYKFMDDMDKESQELDGKARFFTNGFEKYSWTKLLDKRFPGQERLNLYVQAITNMSKNPHIPQIFRDIFKGAVLPYNDAQTLNLFLKEIDGFIFDHSEDLGDSYEYLLNVVGTSGEAGQFRTPRHIIDFIVQVVDPKKNETILDPACGTAGFLISAYKHILRQHDGVDNKTGKLNGQEKHLSPVEKQKMMNNFVGYDIDPGMTRIAIVNMYLHNFPDPKIHEYDTLTYEDRWDDGFDVILANPPFMTPKGGIRPHKRFSVQANRSEVLFVDYILEHLNLKGRAGIIVPEGVVFRNNKAYKELRKSLVEDGLYAVVSLPQGVFAKPGGKGNVKTNILFFDNQLVKKSDEILFVKVENDGFDLGAQRKKIDKNDLPKALEILDAWKNGKKQKSNLAFWVKKEKIAEGGSYNLIGDRYKKVEIRKNQKWSMVELGEVCDIEKGTSITKAKVTEGKIPVIAGGQQPAYYHNQSNREGKTITVSSSGAYAGFVNYFNCSIFASDCTTIKTKDENKILIDFVFRLLKLKQAEIYKFQNGAGQPHVYGKDLAKIKIPIPPIEVQKEIIGQIEVKQNTINHAKEIIKNLEKERQYFGQSLRKLENMESVKLDEVLDYEQPTKYIVRSVNYNTGYKTPVLTAGRTFILGYTDEKDGIFPAEKLPIIIFDDFTTATKFVDFPFKVKSSAMKILHAKKGKADIKFLFYAMQDIKFNHDTHKRYWISDYSKIKIPFPPLEIQKQLVVEVEKEEEIITANRRLIGIMERKINDVLENI